MTACTQSFSDLIWYLRQGYSWPGKGFSNTTGAELVNLGEKKSQFLETLLQKKGWALKFKLMNTDFVKEINMFLLA